MWINVDGMDLLANYRVSLSLLPHHAYLGKGTYTSRAATRDAKSTMCVHDSALVYSLPE